MAGNERQLPLVVGPVSGLCRPGRRLQSCIGLSGPDYIPKDYNTLTFDDLHQSRRGRGNAKTDSKTALKTRLSIMHALDRGRVRGTQDGSLSGSPPCNREDNVDPAENNKLYVPDGVGT